MSTPLRISLAVSPVSTTVNVQGRQDPADGLCENVFQCHVYGAREAPRMPAKLKASELPV